MTEPVAGPSGPGTVVLDLGADVGALILYTPPGLDGREIEISRDTDPAARRTHSQVRARHLAAGTRYAAVYPGLPAGRYTIWAAATSGTRRAPSSSRAARSPRGAGQPDPSQRWLQPALAVIAARAGFVSPGSIGP